MAVEPETDLAGVAAQIGSGNQTQAKKERVKSQGDRQGWRHVGSMNKSVWPEHRQGAHGREVENGVDQKSTIQDPE